MINLKKVIVLLTILLLMVGCNSTTSPDNNISEIIQDDSHSFLSLSDAYPNHSSQDQIIEHLTYSLKYNESYEQADWVIYLLSSDHLNGTQERTENFRIDPDVETGSAALDDYKYSGYDRGHLAPAGDMTWSYNAMSESFYLSNMSPQDASFNRGIWKKLESYVRTWASENEEIYVVTGPILAETLQTIGVNNVAVPDYFYKVILDYKEPELKGLGFILKNESSQSSVESFAVSIDAVEALTGIDFFPSIPDSEENLIEYSCDVSKWTFTAYANDSENPDDGEDPIDDSEDDQSTITVYVTNTGSKYHLSGCRYLSQSKISISLSNAKAQGYTPCSVCNPPR
ncbi:DNA/RNA non-specific endonuclease [Candidatus Latescibacterota bacterium]